MKMTLAIGVLTWRKMNTLRNTLRSYKDGGLLEKADQLMLWCNEKNSTHEEIGKEFGFEVYGSVRNIGAGYGFLRLAEMCTCDYVLFLEDDFSLIEPKEIMEKEIDIGIELLKNGNANTVRYRHRKNPGSPLCSSNLKGREWMCRPLLLEAVYLRDKPDFYKDIKKHPSGAFITTCDCSMYTNNPVMYKTDWFFNYIVLNAPPSKGNLYGGMERGMARIWKRIKPIVSHAPNGLFSHNDFGN